MTHFRKMRPAALAALLLLPACEVVGTFVMAVSGPKCGAFGEPPGFQGNMVVGDERDRIDKAIALFEGYVHTRNPDLLFGLAYGYLQKVGIEPDDPDRDRRIIDLLTLAALCGQGQAASYLGGFYRVGVLGLEKDPELGACLDQAYDPAMDERALIPGRVWACGLRMEDFEE